jgi:pimeloyl-ACP methyl ester carboxylesterase
MSLLREAAGPPSLLWTMIESRALFEAALLPTSLPLLMSAPRGDGHPVLLVPGFVGDAGSMAVLKHYLRNRGYEVDDWGLGRNVGFQRKHARALEQKVRFLHHRHGRKVSLVGWSLGGVFSMFAAHKVPQCVRNVVTLGSPVSSDPERSDSSALVQALYRLVAHPMGPVAHTAHVDARVLRLPPPMPVSCLYSETDGVVPPHEATLHGARDTDLGALHENIRVPGSHIGLGFNALVLWIVAERLSQPEAAWRPFEPQGLPGQLYRLLTPSFVPT